MVEINNDNLAELIESNNKVMVQYGATWCGQCRMVRPKIEQLSQELENVKFFYVDAEKYPESRKLANVSNLPAFAAFKDGKLSGEAMGTRVENIRKIVDEIANN